MHRNTFINSPALLDINYSLKKNPGIYFAGQITGTEGYVCSAASGYVAGAVAASGGGFEPFPPFTAMGALARYVSDESVRDFQPMGINFGIIQGPGEKIKGGKAALKQRTAEISLEYMRRRAESGEV